jgi:hypothetical protein
MLIFLLGACAQVSEPSQMTTEQIKAMSRMRNPICRQVGSYLYCNEQ